MNNIEPAPVQPLRRGRHGMPREEVEADQRRRIMLGVIAKTSDQGYVNTSVAHILSHAKVSRETFYRLYSDKHDAFLATLDAVASRAEAAIADVTSLDGTIRDKLEAAFGRYVDSLTVDPAVARLFLIESSCAGTDTVMRRVAVQDTATQVLIDVLGATSQEGKDACRIVIASVASLISPLVIDGDPSAYDALRTRVVDHIMRLYDAGLLD